MEIKLSLSRKCIGNLCLAVICILILILFSAKPYFSYGHDAIVLTPEDGVLALLNGKWVNAVSKGTNGYYAVTIAGKKDVTVEKQQDGTAQTSKASYKYSRSSKELTISVQEDSGETTVYECAFEPSLILGGRKNIPLIHYLIHAYDYKDMDEDIQKTHPDYFINQEIVFPIIIMTGLVLTVIFCFAFHNKSLSMIMAVILSLFAIVVYLVSPLLAFGTGRLFHILCFAVLGITSAAIFILTRDRNN